MPDSLLLTLAFLSIAFGLIVHLIALIRTKRSSDQPLLGSLNLALKNSEEMGKQLEKRLEELLRPLDNDLASRLRQIAKATDDMLLQARNELSPPQRTRICEIGRLWRDIGLPSIEGRKVLFSHYCRYNEWRQRKIYTDEIYSVIEDYLGSDMSGFEPRHFVLHTPHDGPSVLLAADARTDKNSHALILWAHNPVSNGNGTFAASDAFVPNCQVFCQVYARVKDPLTVVPITFHFAPDHHETNRDTYLIYGDRPTKPELIKNQHRNLHGFSHAVRVSYSRQALISVEVALGIDREKRVAEPDDSGEESDQRREEFFEYLENQLRPTFELIAPGVEKVRRESERQAKNLDWFFEKVVRQAANQVYQDIMLFKTEGMCQITEQAGRF